MRRKILEMNWMEFRDTVPEKIDSVIVPVGTIEAHGIIPLGTDVLIPERLSEMVAGKINMLIAPTINYGITKSLLPYPGSITVSTETFGEHLFEVCAGLADCGFRKIFIMNGHGGNTEEIRHLVRRLWSDKKVFSAAISWWLLCEDIVQRVYGETGGHAGIDETAAIHAIDEGLIQKKRLKTIRGATFKNGVIAQPFFSSIIQYKDGEGMPVLDKEKADLFLKQVAEKIRKTMLEIIEGWKLVR